MLYFPLHLEKLRVDGFSLWLLARVYQTVALNGLFGLRTAALKVLLGFGELDQDLVEHLPHLTLLDFVFGEHREQR